MSSTNALRLMRGERARDSRAPRPQRGAAQERRQVHMARGRGRGRGRGAEDRSRSEGGAPRCTVSKQVHESLQHAAAHPPPPPSARHVTKPVRCITHRLAAGRQLRVARLSTVAYMVLDKVAVSINTILTPLHASLAAVRARPAQPCSSALLLRSWLRVATRIARRDVPDAVQLPRPRCASASGQTRTTPPYGCTVLVSNATT